MVKPDVKDRYSLNLSYDNDQRSIYPDMPTTTTSNTQIPEPPIQNNSANVNYFQTQPASGMFDYSTMYGYQKVYSQMTPHKSMHPLHYSGYGYRNAHSSPSINLNYRALGYIY